MVGIGNRRDLLAEKAAVLAYVAKGEEVGHAVYTESVARHLGVAWADAHAVLSALRQDGLTRYEQVERPYRSRSRPGETYRTFRWWPRAGRRG